MRSWLSVFPWFGGALWFYTGRWLDRKGLTTLAESCYRNGASGVGRAAAEAGFQLGQRLMARDLSEEAVNACREALRADPTHAKAWCALGAAQRRLARMDGSREAYEKAVELDPDYAQAWSNLGEWWLVKGEIHTSLEKIERALRIEPGLLQALNNRVAALYELGKFQEAEAAAREAIDLHPNEAALYVNLGNVLHHSGKKHPALKAFRKALECDADCPEAYLALSALLGETRRLAETLPYFEHEIAVKGESVQRLASLAIAQQAKGCLHEAEVTCQKVLRMQPNNISALNVLASCLTVRGDHRGAICLYEKALAGNPNMPAIYSNIAFDATYVPDISASEVFAYHREWADRFEKLSVAKTFSYEQSREAGRPLRIGYVSGDFGMHPVGFLLRDVMRNHDRQQFTIYCYSMMRNSDDVTEAIRSNANEWIDVLLLSDDELAEQIHQDQIDILVDLSGHTAHNRLPTFVRRPSPVQATWIGYFHSTGLKNIDYFITDPVTTPANAGQLFSETPVWLPHSRFCYSPPEYAPGVVPSPVLDVGYITFGSFNRVEKLVDSVISAWIRILDAVPGSRLLLKAGVLENEGVRDSLRRRFAELGMKGDRLELRGPSQHPEMLAQYGDVDIALDPFPFNGGMTTLEALWMGVPVVTLAGTSVVARQSASALTNIGLPELIFDDLDMYVDGAISLAHNIERLSGLRQQIRQRMANSPLCHPEQFTHDLEKLYRRMWHAWLRGERLGTQIVPGTSAARKKVLHVGRGGTDKSSLPAHFQDRWQEISLDIEPNVSPEVANSALDMAAVESGSVDAVYSSHNIEHFCPGELEAALKEFRRALKPDGFLVLTCPGWQLARAPGADDQLEKPIYVAPTGPIVPNDIPDGQRPATAKGNLFVACKTGLTAQSLERALRESGFETAVVERGPSCDLWALAYLAAVESGRLERDRKSCFPASLNQ